MRVIDEAFLQRFKVLGDCDFVIYDDDILTPSAKDYIAVKKIKVCVQKQKAKDGNAMPVDNTRYGSAKYVDAVTGAKYRVKPEDMTHIKGNLLVKKSHPRIAFRGKLDSLEADILLAQVVAHKSGNDSLVSKLGECLTYVRDILAAEVKEIPLEDATLFGLDKDEIRVRSHNPETFFAVAHPVPCYEMGEVFLTLNKLRTSVRDTELCAVRAFGGKRADIVLALNRLSSAVYVLELELLSKKG